MFFPCLPTILSDNLLIYIALCIVFIFRVEFFLRQVGGKYSSSFFSLFISYLHWKTLGFHEVDTIMAAFQRFKKRLQVKGDEKLHEQTDIWCNRDLIPLPPSRRTWGLMEYFGYWSLNFLTASFLTICLFHKEVPNQLNRLAYGKLPMPFSKKVCLSDKH